MAPRGNSKKAKATKTFDDAALSQLTAKIEQKLGGDTNGDKERPIVSTANNRKDNGPKRKRQDGPQIDGLGKGHKHKKLHIENGQNDRSRGSRPHGNSAKTSSSTLLAEIKALGGDENDLELVANVDSDAEEGSGPQQGKDADAQVDDKFKNDLAKFAASLGLERLRQQAEAESEEEEDEAPESDEEAEDEEENEPAERPQPTPQEGNTKGQKGKLVSKHPSIVYLAPNSAAHPTRYLNLDRTGMPQSQETSQRPFLRTPSSSLPQLPTSKPMPRVSSTKMLPHTTPARLRRRRGSLCRPSCRLVRYPTRFQH